MNAVPLSPAQCSQEMNGHESDIDSNPDETLEYYQPISSIPIGDDDSGSESDPADHDRDSVSALQHLPSGFLGENGIASLSLNEAAADAKEVEDDEEEEREREASNSAIRRAFREDESRSAPLRLEDSVRVMEVMRGVSFGGNAPEWVQMVPEDQWVEQLRKLSQRPGSPK